MLRGRLLATWCCMCCCDGESVDHLLLHCPVIHSLWTFMIQAFGIHWVMPGSVAGLLSCWHQWLGKHNSDIWKLVPGCLMWIVWLEQNHRSFEDNEKTLDDLKGFMPTQSFGVVLLLGVLLIVLLSLSLCLPLAQFPDFLFCCAVCSFFSCCSSS